MQPKTLLRLSLAGLVVLAACDKGLTGSDAADLSREEAAVLAPAYSDIAEAEIASFGAPTYYAANLDVITTTTTFTRTRTCPLSGSVKVEGSYVRTANREAKTATHVYTATRTEQACAFNLREGSITITGSPNTAINGNWTVTNGVPGVRTLTQKGSFTWARSNGKSGSCTVDLTTTWDPAAHSVHVVGTFCNRTVDVTRTRTA